MLTSSPAVLETRTEPNRSPSQDKFVQRFSKVPAASTSSLGEQADEPQYALFQGRGIERMPVPQFAMPSVENASAVFHRHSNPSG